MALFFYTHLHISLCKYGDQYLDILRKNNSMVTIYMNSSQHQTDKAKLAIL